jgi:hypothetical protein
MHVFMKISDTALLALSKDDCTDNDPLNRQHSTLDVCLMGYYVILTSTRPRPVLLGEVVALLCSNDIFYFLCCTSTRIRLQSLRGILTSNKTFASFEVILPLCELCPLLWLLIYREMADPLKLVVVLGGSQAGVFKKMYVSSFALHELV